MRAQRDEPWPRTARLASQVVTNGMWKETHGSASDWLADAASKTPHALNTFRRHIRVVDFLIAQLPPEQVIRQLDTSLPFGPLEILMRLFDVAPTEAKSLFPKVLAGDITYQRMREIYQKTKSNPGSPLQGRRAFAARAQQFESKTIDCIRESIKNAESRNTFFEGVPIGVKIDFDTKTRGFPYGRADLLAITPEFIDGFDMKLFGADDNKYLLIRTLEQVAFQSSFYRQLWLIYPGSSDEQDSHRDFIEAMRTHLIHLELTSVGIAQLGEEIGTKPEIRILPHPHEPSRGHLLRQFLSGK